MKVVRMFLDILMFILMLILMGPHITDNIIHEILGVTTFILFIIHHILNVRYYKNIFKGKYNFMRTFILIIDIALFIAILGMMISSVIISSDFFAFLNIPTSSFGRNLHMVSTAWSFILMAMHVGLHLNAMVYKIKNKLKSSNFEYVSYLLLIVILIYGIYSFIKHKLWEDMFLLIHFKFFDYDQNPIIFYLEMLSIVILIATVTYLIIKFSNKRKIQK